MLVSTLVDFILSGTRSIIVHSKPVVAEGLPDVHLDEPED